MSGCLVAIALMLVSQVGSANDRYQAAPPPSAGSAASPTGTNPAPQGGLTPITGAPATGRSGQNSVAPVGDNNAPYSPPPAASGPSQQPMTPLRGNNSAVPIGSAPPPSAYQQGAGGQLGSAPPSQQATGTKPSALIRSMLTAPRDSQIVGDPVTLIDVVSSTTSRTEQTARIEAYWDLCSSLADYYLSLREKSELQQLRAVVPNVGPAWQEAEKRLAVRISTAQRAALASQMRLGSTIGRAGGSLPLPADMPHCGSYNTHYDEIFSSRPSSEAKELAALLPLRYAELKDAAAAVPQANDWFQQVARKDSDGTGTVRALEFLALERRAFVQICRDYNRRISRYSELATPGQVGAERLVGMLIRRDDATATRPFLPNGTFNRQSRDKSQTPPPTFVQEGGAPVGDQRADTTIQDSKVRATAAESEAAPQREHSLLVPTR